MKNLQYGYFCKCETVNQNHIKNEWIEERALLVTTKREANKRMKRGECDSVLDALSVEDFEKKYGKIFKGVYFLATRVGETNYWNAACCYID